MDVIAIMEDKLRESGLHIAGGFVKKIWDKKALEDSFVQAGEWVARYEYDGTEQSELRSIVFAQDNMKVLANKMYEVNDFEWIATLEKCVDNLLVESALTVENQARCKKHFMDIIRKDMECAFESIMERAYTRQTYDNSVAVLGQLEQNTAGVRKLYSMIEGLVQQYPGEAGNRQRQERADRAGCYAGESKIENAMQAKWNLASLNIRGIFAGETEQRQEIIQLTRTWRMEREAYPGWYIVPYSIHRELEWNTRENGLLQKLGLVAPNERVEFCYEYVWRCERGMFLYDSRIQHNIRTVWQDCVSLVDNWRQNGDEESYSHWFYIGQVLLREYREDGKISEWNNVYRILKHQEGICENYVEELKMEWIKQAFSVFDIGKVIREIHVWNIPREQYALRLQIIGVMAECGEVAQAIERMTVLKQDIDFKLQEEENPQYRLFLKSMSVCMLQLESLMLQGHAHQERQYEQQQENINQIVKRIETEKVYFDWHNILNNVKSELLESYVKNYDVEEAFELNRETITLLGGRQSEIESYYLYRILDTLALPLEINHVTLMSSLELPWISALFRINFHLALFMLVRGSKTENCKKIVTRRFLSDLSGEKVASEIQYLMGILEKNLTELPEKTKGSGHIYCAIQGNVPELLKRYVSRCPEYLQKEVLLLVKKMMETDGLVLDNHMDALLVGIMNQMSERTKAEMLGTLINTRICEHPSFWGHRAALDIFDCYFRKKDLGALCDLCRVEKEQIKELLAFECETVYEWRTKITRLELLNDLGMLDSEQQQELGRLVWSRLDETTGLPDLPNRYIWSYMTLPYEGENVPAVSIKAFFLHSGLMKTMGDESGCKFTFGEIRYLDELYAMAGALEKDFWTVEEVEHIFADAIAYWELLRRKLTDATRDDVEHEYRRRVNKIVCTLAEVYKSITGEVNQAIKAQICSTIQEMKLFDMGTLQLEVLVSEENVCGEIQKRMYAANNELVVDALNAAYSYISKFPEKNESEDLLEGIMQILRTRKRPGLLSAIYILHNLLYSKCSAMTDEVLQRLDDSLLEMKKATRYVDYLDNERKLKEVISERKACVALSYQIWKHMKENCGEGVKVWRAIAQSDSFSEVRNEWL